MRTKPEKVRYFCPTPTLTNTLRRFYRERTHEPPRQALVYQNATEKRTRHFCRVFAALKTSLFKISSIDVDDYERRIISAG